MADRWVARFLAALTTGRQYSVAQGFVTYPVLGVAQLAEYVVVPPNTIDIGMWAQQTLRGGSFSAGAGSGQCSFQALRG